MKTYKKKLKMKYFDFAMLCSLVLDFILKACFYLSGVSEFLQEIHPILAPLWHLGILIFGVRLLWSLFLHLLLAFGYYIGSSFIHRKCNELLEAKIQWYRQSLAILLKEKYNITEDDFKILTSLSKCSTLPNTSKNRIMTEAKKNSEITADSAGVELLATALQVGQNINTEDIIIKKWHKNSNSHHYINLKELWQNGFRNGQSVMAHRHNKKLLHSKKEYLSLEGFYATNKFFDEIWRAFWYDLREANIFVKNQKAP